MTSTTADNDLTEIATLRIELIDSDPLIWRELEIPTSITLKGLHDIVQASMNWEDYHLWQFVVDRRTYGLPREDDWEPPRKIASRVRLRDVLSSAKSKTKIIYTYDFGDGWEHRLIVSKVRPALPNIVYPRFIAGERNAPPEDCGGIYGFYDKLDIRADPNDPDHAHITEWFGEYDPDKLDEMPIRYALARIAACAKGVATRTLKSRRPN